MALTAGFNAAQGDAVVLIDADLQNPPEFIHEMIKKWETELASIKEMIQGQKYQQIPKILLIVSL